MGDGLSQNDLDNLFGDIQLEAKAQKETNNDDGLSQNDLDALFGDIQAETKKPRVVKDVTKIDSLEGSEVLSQDQIDELLKSFQND